MTGNGSDRARFGPFEVDLHTHELWKFGTRMRLVGQPFETLAFLLSRPGELVTREELRTGLWPADTFVDFNHGLNAAVNKLREALSDSAESPRYIETLPRRGYRFIAKVEWLEAKPAGLPTEPRVPAPFLPDPSRQAQVDVAFNAPPNPAFEETPIRRGLPLYLMGAGVLFSLLLAAALISRSVSGYRTDRPTPPMLERTRPLMSISNTNAPAFLPMETLSPFTDNTQQQGKGEFT